ncbi:MAG: o-succinylbenzoate synthase [Nodosilinea sp.]
MPLQLATKAYRRPFRQPLQTAQGLWPWREGLLVQLTDPSGRAGYGEIAPIPWFGNETLEAAWRYCELHRGTISDDLTPGDDLPATQFGLESALADLQGSPTNGELPNSPFALAEPLICGLLPAGEKALTAWLTLVRQGTQTLKWKIGAFPIDEEIGWLGLLMQALPAGCRLRLDANGGLSVPLAERWLGWCDRDRTSSPSPTLEYLEQPLPPSQFEPMQRLSQTFQTPIALDESVATLTQLEQCERQGWTGRYVIKPAIAGSPRRLRTLCQPLAQRLVFSSAFETVIGRRAALALAMECYQSVQLSAPPALGFGTLGWFKDDWDTLTPAQLWARL